MSAWSSGSSSASVPYSEAKTPPRSMSPTSEHRAGRRARARPMFARSPARRLISAGLPAPSQTTTSKRRAQVGERVERRAARSSCLELLVGARGRVGVRLAHHEHLAVAVARRLDQHGVHRRLGLDPARPRPASPARGRSRRRSRVTVRVERHVLRLERRDADALAREPAADARRSTTLLPASDVRARRRGARPSCARPARDGERRGRASDRAARARPRSRAASTSRRRRRARRPGRRAGAAGARRCPAYASVPAEPDARARRRTRPRSRPAFGLGCCAPSRRSARHGRVPPRRRERRQRAASRAAGQFTTSSSPRRRRAEPARSARCGWPTIASSVFTARCASTPGAPATAAQNSGAITASTVFSATDSIAARAELRRRRARCGSRPTSDADARARAPRSRPRSTSVARRAAPRARASGRRAPPTAATARTSARGSTRSARRRGSGGDRRRAPRRTPRRAARRPVDDALERAARRLAEPGDGMPAPRVAEQRRRRPRRAMPAAVTRGRPRLTRRPRRSRRRAALAVVHARDRPAAVVGVQLGDRQRARRRSARTRSAARPARARPRP